MQIRSFLYTQIWPVSFWSRWADGMSVLDVLVVSQYVAANACWSFRKWQSYTASRERLQNDVELESEILLRIFSCVCLKRQAAHARIASHAVPFQPMSFCCLAAWAS